MEKSLITVNTVVIEDEMKYDGQTVLIYRMEYPQFQSCCYQKSLDEINEFYKNKALEFENYCKNDLYKMAVEQYQFDKKNNFPVRIFEAFVFYQLTYNKDCILSLYFDQYVYMGGAHGNTVRYSQTFQLQEGKEIKLSQLIQCSPDYKTYLLRQVNEQIKKNPGIYFENYEKLIVETFREDSFYCIPEGIVIYYQQYDIAPYSSGIREFLIPYSNCVLDPAKTCIPI